jgi:hypothetical protein
MMQKPTHGGPEAVFELAVGHLALRQDQGGLIASGGKNALQVMRQGHNLVREDLLRNTIRQMIP